MRICQLSLKVFFHVAPSMFCNSSLSLLDLFCFNFKCFTFNLLHLSLCHDKFAFSLLAGKSPFGQLPVLEIKDGASSEPIVLCQSVAILRYLANEFGMYSFIQYASTFFFKLMKFFNQSNILFSVNTICEQTGVTNCAIDIYS